MSQIQENLMQEVLNYEFESILQDHRLYDLANIPL
jgi:hypothetical protein